ncbi:hypothetical protein BJF90_13630 [Pseudonocardia sp. CNS-004]|nr:hypothetical protein BJF90_13630 [Pseudonocardia sp. CNS-004]
MGSLDGVDAVCRAIANRSGCAVVSVDYRLAPEHKYPIPLHDCADVVAHLARRGASSASTAPGSPWPATAQAATSPQPWR